MARTLTTLNTWSVELGAELGHTFDRDLNPHFLLEEEVLITALQKLGAAELGAAELGAAELVERTLREHRLLREQVQAARQGDGPSAKAFGHMLKAHVRFEERILFPACEASLPEHVLDEIALRAPKES